MKKIYIRFRKRIFGFFKAKINKKQATTQSEHSSNALSNNFWTCDVIYPNYCSKFSYIMNFLLAAQIKKNKAIKFKLYNYKIL